ncbi:MAG: hypothetical protein OIN84_13440 [Candidatus Methanoperedens sp.]|uniref:hypothetical protein n=1 Tax=Candidatus Methanoperedens sp. BLZ2 TaxID=2035255 RepID=UPI0015969BF4|nr:hypothetical protein [Candidatus Methanoperedens sp. BLZ2]MBZ0173934.1 hypothetical protein [Candidatus Methanoperedens nitroreducens]MCX9078963.1 hypothetical protein [Candidatus Methanoperedens sp.]
MASIYVGEDDKKYLEKLRKESPAEKIPNMKEIVHYLINFTKKHEKEFLLTMKE